MRSVLKIRGKAAYTPVKYYTRGNEEVRAIGMCHIAAPEFYSSVQKIIDQIPHGLLEAVKPADENAYIPPEKRKFLAISENLSYHQQKEAQYMGCVSQHGQLKYASGWKNHDMSLDELINMTHKDTLDELFRLHHESYYQHMDRIHAKEPEALARVKKGQIMFSMRVASIPFFLPIMEKLSSTQMDMSAILHKRDHLLQNALVAMLESHSVIGVCYGAAHLTNLHHFLKRNGFRHEDEQWLEAFRVTENLSYRQAKKIVSSYR